MPERPDAAKNPQQKPSTAVVKCMPVNVLYACPIKLRERQEKLTVLQTSYNPKRSVLKIVTKKAQKSNQISCFYCFIVKHQRKIGHFATGLNEAKILPSKRQCEVALPQD